MNIKNKLEIDIAEKIKNYRKDELSFTIDDEHVFKWINQFDKEERGLILQETNNILEKCYLKKSDVKEFINSVITDEEIIGKEITETIKKVKFINIQRKGSSQKKLLKLLEKEIYSMYNININEIKYKDIDKYIYLDDGLYSGATVRHDIENWIKEAKPNTSLDIVFLAVYSSGKFYANKEISKLCKDKNITFKMWWCNEFKNSPNDWYNYDCLWPKKLEGNKYVDLYIDKLRVQEEITGKKSRLFREKEYNTELFTSATDKDIFEKALLKAGSYIVSIPKISKESMRPMGYDYFNSLGFGAFFATYMNISNNCPLAIWWGDSSMPEWHPFSKWYPLLPRKINEKKGDIFEL